MMPRERKEIQKKLKMLKLAKEIYKNQIGSGICFCMSIAAYLIYGNRAMPYVKELIPEFNVDTFIGIGATLDTYWWPVSDRASRIKAFNMLIKLYEDKLNEAS